MFLETKTRGPLELDDSNTTSDLVLVVDDEPSICWGFERLLGDQGHRVVSASSAEEGLEIAARLQPSLIVLDVRLPGRDGITALPEFLKAAPHARIVIMTAFGDLDTAVGAVRAGACEYLIKPFRLDDALRVCQQALELSRASSHSLHQKNLHQKNQLDQAGSIVGQSRAMQHAFRQIALLADSDLTVLITGETGTGKELVAEAIHRHSPRSRGPYLPIAPVAYNPDLIESELFGHVKGAFTGASDDRRGLFELADGGTLLLDEVGELPLAVQAKLLRVLESGQFTRIGDNKLRTVNVRFLAATNRDLRQAVAAGTFREDLLYRLNAAHIHLPPLRERPEDLLPLSLHFLQRMKYPGAEQAIDEQLLRMLGERQWRGNIREFRNAVEHAAVVARGRPLRWSDFPLEAETAAEKNASEKNVSETSELTAGPAPSILDESLQILVKQLLERQSNSVHDAFLQRVEPTLLRMVLAHTGNNKARAAEILGIHRGTLRERLRNYGLDDQ